MDITDINPATMSKSDATAFASELVGINQQALDNAGYVIIGPSVDMVLNNEQEYSEFYKPLLKGVRKDVKESQQKLEKISSNIVSQAIAQVNANAGQLSNTIRRIGETNANFATRVNRLPMPTTVTIGGMPSVDAIPDDNVTTTIGNTVSTMPTIINGGSVGSTTTNGGTPTGINSIGVSPPLPTDTQAYSGMETTTLNPPGGTTGQVGPVLTQPPIPSPPGMILGGGGVSPPLPIGPCGPPAINAVPPQCPPGYVASYNPSTECWQCDPIGGTQVFPPPPSPPPQPCNVFPPPPPPPPKPSPTPTCPKPTTPCPSGYDYWWNPSLGGWQCTPGGVEPVIPPPPPPIIPDCQHIIDRTNFVVNMDCIDLPTDFRKQLEKCGFAKCEPEYKEKKDDMKKIPGEWLQLAIRIAIAIGWTLQ